MNLKIMLQIAGIMHLGLMCAGALMPGVVNMRAHLASLPRFIRQLFWVYYCFIGLTLLSFGTITTLFAGDLANGSNLSRAICAFLMIFWTLRLIVGTFVFDMRQYLTNGYRRFGYHVLNLTFAYLPIVYALAVFRPRNY